MSAAARPFCEQLRGPAEPLAAARLLRGEPGAVALSGTWAGGGLILSSHPLLLATEDEDPFALLDRGAPIAVNAEPDSAHPTGERPRVGGGWFGWLGFSLARTIEEVSPPPPRREPLAPFQLAFHDHLVRRDPSGRWWFEALWTEARAAFLQERRDHWAAALTAADTLRERPVTGALHVDPPGAAGHRVAVAEAIRRIEAGDLSQVNVCLRLDATLTGDPLDLWIRGVTLSDPAHAAYFAGSDGASAVASFSPELFLRRAGRQVETRPIKGTAPRSSDPAQLRASVKDRAENLMIVDLMRNDLGRVCEYGTVRATALCEVEPAAGVWHLVSTVQGTLRDGVGDGRLLRATFPPGSVTGAPKVQALTLIHRLEPTAREVFCGAHGLVSPLSGLELAVAIRTAEVHGHSLWLGAGGGIVSDSDPAAELAEALAKAAGVAAATGLTLTPPAAGHRGDPELVAALATLPRPDPAHGVFETMRAEAGAVPLVAEHLDRLRRSCAALGLQAPADLDRRVAVAAVDLGTGAIRVSLSPSRGVSITVRPLPAIGATELIPVVVPGGLGPHKWSDRRLIDGHSRTGVTPLICDLDGEVLEAGYAAVLFLIDGALVAPPADRRRLDSVSRRAAITAATERGLTVITAPVSLAEARAASAIVLTSSLRGPHPGVLVGGPPVERSAAVCAALSRS